MLLGFFYPTEHTPIFCILFSWSWVWCHDFAAWSFVWVQGSNPGRDFLFQAHSVHGLCHTLQMSLLTLKAPLQHFLPHLSEESCTSCLSRKVRFLQNIINCKQNASKIGIGENDTRSLHFVVYIPAKLYSQHNVTNKKHRWKSKHCQGWFGVLVLRADCCWLVFSANKSNVQLQNMKEWFYSKVLTNPLRVILMKAIHNYLPSCIWIRGGNILVPRPLHSLGGEVKPRRNRTCQCSLPDFQGSNPLHMINWRLQNCRSSYKSRQKEQSMRAKIKLF